MSQLEDDLKEIGVVKIKLEYNGRQWEATGWVESGGPCKGIGDTVDEALEDMLDGMGEETDEDGEDDDADDEDEE